MTVESVRVGDVLALQRREVVVEPGVQYEEIGIRSFGRGIFHKAPVSGIELGAKRVFRIEAGDLVLSNVFSWEGAIALATDAEVGKIGSHRFMTFTPVDARIEASWARWWFLSEPGLELIGQASPGSAGRNRTLAIDRFEALEIPLPPIDEQRRVAARLDWVRAASVDLSARGQQVDVLATAVVVSAAFRPDLADEEKTASGWRRVVLGDLLAPSAIAEPVDPEGTYRIAGVFSFGRGLIDRGTISGTDTAYKTLTMLRADNVVYSKLGAWEGASAVVSAEFDGFWVSSEFPVLQIHRSQLIPGFFRALTRSSDFWTLISTGTRGSMARRKRITPTEYLATPIWLPPLDEQARVASIQDSLDRAEVRRLAAKVRLGALLPAAHNEAFAGLS